MRKTLSATIFAALTIPAFALSPDDEVTIDAIGKADFVQGEAPAAWEKGELYILECWATWCGPCIAVIPHVDELYDKYKEEGLNVIGMNVWEEDKDKVAGFVKEKGEGMSYPVAYVGKGGDFEETWLKPAGVRGIPHAFLVMDGKFLFSTHPGSLKEDMIKDLLAGGEKAEAVIAKIQKAEANKEATQEQLQAFMQAAQADDFEGMEAAIAEVEKLDPEFQFLSRMKIDTAVAKKDWDSAANIFDSIEDEKIAVVTAATILQQTDADPEAPSKALLEKMSAALNGTSVNDPPLRAALARVEWKLGNKEKAIAAAKAAAAEPGRFPKEPLEAFAASFETDEPQTMEDLVNAVRASQQ